MTTWKNRKKVRLQQAVSFLCQPETFLTAGGAASASRMDMMAQFMPRPGIKKLNLVLNYQFFQGGDWGL